MDSTRSDNVVAVGIDEATFMRDYAQFHMEWVNGEVIALAPSRDTHNQLSGFLRTLFDAYLESTGAGKVFHETFVMRLAVADGVRRREPDLFVVLEHNYDRLTKTYLDGPADLVVEIISPESSARDRGEKFGEYEAAGVREYWLIDPHRTECLFYVLHDSGLFLPHPLGEDGLYTSAVLQNLTIRPTNLFDSTQLTTRNAVRWVDERLP